MELAQDISGPVAVIGDIHGQVAQLDRVLQQLFELPDFENRWIVFIGDLVDRGPDPKAAIDRLLEVRRRHERTTLVCGNHELAMTAALNLVETPDYCDWGGRWMDHYGCGPTFRSYGIDDVGNFQSLADALPADHRDLLSNIPWCVEHPEYFFVHAGLDPAAPFAMQREVLRERDYTLTRPQWLCSKSLTFQEPPRDCDRIVVSGHVRVPQVTYGYKRLLIDTTGGEGGSLSCILLPENQIIHSDPEQGLPPVSMHAKTEPKKKKGWLW
ncbi:metallophosphoesterase [Planctomicrobium piriforme]|uniref:Serine/threonine protein phosphatase 1 n=1 Tax=Planctomicrobium piriforme TaxID=1576369 RepID=A0A1I3I894_9PLAN|nr:metallophosphoesterase [Planctomicrobium piriforme]SFI43973.1 serine/threonine protein phosphatase 1 [Planctomicrobium piriforme]